MRISIVSRFLKVLALLGSAALALALPLHAANGPVVAFAPNPVRIPNGGQVNVTVTITLTLSAVDELAGAVRVFVVDADGILDPDDLLDQFDIPVRGRAGARVTVTQTFTLRCPDGDVWGRLGSSGETTAELAIELARNGPNFGEANATCVEPGAAALITPKRAVHEVRSISKLVEGSETNVLEEQYACAEGPTARMRQAAYEIRAFSLGADGSVTPFDEFPSAPHLNGEFRARLLVRQRLEPRHQRGHFEGPWQIIGLDENERLVRIAEGRMEGSVVAGTHATEPGAPPAHFEGSLKGTMAFGPGNPKQLRASVQGTGLATALGVSLGEFNMRIEGAVEVYCQPTGLALIPTAPPGRGGLAAAPLHAFGEATYHDRLSRAPADGALSGMADDGG
ncbi:MAG: hypothetical protein ACO1SX_22035 [Actinomycetota bacterium]